MSYLLYLLLTHHLLPTHKLCILSFVSKHHPIYAYTHTHTYVNTNTHFVTHITHISYTHRWQTTNYDTQTIHSSKHYFFWYVFCIFFLYFFFVFFVKKKSYNNTFFFVFLFFLFFWECFLNWNYTAGSALINRSLFHSPAVKHIFGAYLPFIK